MNRTKLIKTASIISVSGNTLLAASKIIILEERLRKSIPNLYDIIIHIEPSGNYERHEQWGLNERNLNHSGKPVD
jgi:divalent metal cation (Fe/Co/Zn/Cd) transporter